MLCKSWVEYVSTVAANNWTVGRRRVEGEKPTASVYRVKWENLTRPVKKKETFEELFSEFLKPSETPLGTTVSDTVSDIVSETVSETELITDIVEETDSEIDSETDSRQFSVNCYISSERVPDVEDLSSYLRRIGRL